MSFWGKAPQTQAIDDCLQKIVQERHPASWSLFGMSINQMADLLQRRLSDEGTEISFDEALKAVARANR